MGYAALGQASNQPAYYVLWKNTPQRWAFVGWIYATPVDVNFMAVHIAQARVYKGMSEDAYIITSGDGSNRIIGGMASW